MNGHAAMTLRERLDEDIYDRLMWIITHMRNLVLVLVLALCVMYPTIRRGFALSATGHVAYMIVRLGPVFRIGSMYMKGEKEKKRWSKELTDGERLQLLLAGELTPTLQTPIHLTNTIVLTHSLDLPHHTYILATHTYARKISVVCLGIGLTRYGMRLLYGPSTHNLWHLGTGHMLHCLAQGSMNSHLAWVKVTVKRQPNLH